MQFIHPTITQWASIYREPLRPRVKKLRKAGIVPPRSLWSGGQLLQKQVLPGWGQRRVLVQVFQRVKVWEWKDRFLAAQSSFVRKPVTDSPSPHKSSQSKLLYFISFILLSRNYRDFNYCSLYQALSKGLFIVLGESKLGSLGYNDRHKVACDQEKLEQYSLSSCSLPPLLLKLI